MDPKLEKVDATLGAIITNINLADMDDPSWAFVDNAFANYAALIFPGQFLDVKEQEIFSSHFGDLELLRGPNGGKVVPISNVKKDGMISEEKEHVFKTLRGNEGWHMDSTYMPLAAKAGVLSAKTVPPKGGETELADMRAAYDVLDDGTKKKIQTLSAYHSLYQSQAKDGYIVETGTGYGYHTQGAPLRPLVKKHPVTGRNALCIGRHAYKIPEMKDEDAVALLDKLLENACQPPRIYTHKWKPGDLIIWDNRCVLHRACPYDFSKPRILQASRISGDPKTEFANTAADNLASAFEGTA
jgi:alpha-ketoglutarate-dependent taurine dioxygenase